MAAPPYGVRRPGGDHLRHLRHGPAPNPTRSEWLEAAAATGMPVDPRAVMAAPPASTNPAGLAVKAVAEQADPGPFLRRLREAIFLERRRVDRGDALLDLARETTPALDLEHAQDRLRLARAGRGARSRLRARGRLAAVAGHRRARSSSPPAACGVRDRRRPTPARPTADAAPDAGVGAAPWRPAPRGVPRTRRAARFGRARPRRSRCCATCRAPRAAGAVARSRSSARSPAARSSAASSGRLPATGDSPSGRPRRLRREPARRAASRSRSSARSLALASSITSKSSPAAVSRTKCSNGDRIDQVGVRAQLRQHPSALHAPADAGSAPPWPSSASSSGSSGSTPSGHVESASSSASRSGIAVRVVAVVVQDVPHHPRRPVRPCGPFPRARARTCGRRSRSRAAPSRAVGELLEPASKRSSAAAPTARAPPTWSTHRPPARRPSRRAAPARGSTTPRGGAARTAVLASSARCTGWVRGEADAGRPPAGRRPPRAFSRHLLDLPVELRQVGMRPA